MITTKLRKYYRSVFFLICFISGISVFSQDTYLDQFNSVSYSNSDGTLDWSGNSWIENGDDLDDGPAAEYISVIGGQFRFYWIWSETIERTADLSGAATATLSFNLITNTLDAGEEFLVTITGNGATIPITISNTTALGAISQDISTAISSNTTVTISGGAENWESVNEIIIDDFQIAVTTPIVDTDGDTIPDDVDLDDDNDGMTDEEEYCTNLNVSLFASGNSGTRSETFTHTDTGYLKLDFTALDNSFQLLINGGGIHNSILEFQNGALDAGEIYAVFQSDDAFITSPWLVNTTGLPRIRLIIDENGEATLFGSRTRNSTILEPMHALGGVAFNTINWVVGNTNSYTIINQDGPGPESMNASLFASALCDFDGDGTINSLDLDSDNDGIYDIVEAGVLDVSGVNDVNNDGIIDGLPAAFGANGLYDVVEDNDIQAANLTYTITDTNSDGNYDAFDLDSDSDGCFDAIDAGFADPDNDGYLGNLPVSVNGDAIVTGQGGYTTPADLEPNNGIYDFQEAATPFWITAAGALDTSVECAINAPVKTLPICIPLTSTFFNEQQFAWGFGLQNNTGSVVNGWQVVVADANYQIDPTQLTNQGAFTYSELDNGNGTYDHIFTGTSAIANFGGIPGGNIEWTGVNFGFNTTSSGITILCGDNPLIQQPVASDGCGVVTVNEISDLTTPGSCPNSYTRVLTYQAVNSAGNTSPLFTTTITVDDTTAPTASNLSPLSVLCTAEIPAPDILVVSDEADNCTANPVVTFISDASDGGTNPEIITRTYRITDACNNSTDVTRIIAVTPILITTQPANVSSGAGDSPTFSVVANNADTYQWQISINNGASFSNISDGTAYSGTQTATLAVNSVDIDKNNYQYRAIVSNSGSICAAVTSNAGILTTTVKTVITNRRITYRVKKN